jgi:hypothetical protein
MPPTNHSTQPDHYSLSRSRVDWAIEAARRVRAEPVGALGEAGNKSWDGGTVFNKITAPKRMGRPKGQGAL